MFFGMYSHSFIQLSQLLLPLHDHRIAYNPSFTTTSVFHHNITQDSHTGATLRPTKTALNSNRWAEKCYFDHRWFESLLVQQVLAEIRSMHGQTECNQVNPLIGLP